MGLQIVYTGTDATPRAAPRGYMNSTGNRLRGTLDLEYPLILSTPNDSALYNDPLFDIPPGRGLIIRLTRQQIRPDADGTSSA